MRRARPSSPQVITPDLPPDIPQDEDGDDHIVERAEYRDELRDEINWAHDPHEQPDQSDPRAQRNGAVGEKVANQPEHVGDDSNELCQPRVPRTEDPKQRNKDRPCGDEAECDAANGSPVHRATLPRRHLGRRISRHLGL